MAIRLKRLAPQKEPYWLEPAPGLGFKLQVRPYTAVTAAQGRTYVEQHRERLRDLYEAYGGDINDEDPTASAALGRVFYAMGLAQAAVVGWEGVLQDEGDEPAPLTEVGLNELFLGFPEMVNLFLDRYMESAALAVLEGNGLPPAGSGNAAAGGTTAEPAPNSTPPAPGESGAPTGSTAPTSKAASKRKKAGSSGS